MGRHYDSAEEADDWISEHGIGVTRQEAADREEDERERQQVAPAPGPAQ